MRSQQLRRLAILMIGRTIAMSSAFSTSSPSTKKGALIFLHGLGDSPAGWSSLAQTLPSLKPNLRDIQYVFPPAPTVSLTINDGMTMPGWFDLYDWPIGVGCQDDKVGLIRSMSQMDAEVAKLESEGIPRNKIVLGGFSQGGAVALLSAYHENGKEKAPFAGCAVLSGWLTLQKEIVVESTPTFWAHGQYDDKVLFEQQAFGASELRKLGVTVSDFKYPMGHESHPKEIDELATFLDKALFGEEETRAENLAAVDASR